MRIRIEKERKREGRKEEQGRKGVGREQEEGRKAKERWKREVGALRQWRLGVRISGAHASDVWPFAISSRSPLLSLAFIRHSP